MSGPNGPTLFRPPPGWALFCRVLPGLALGALAGGLLVAGLLVFDIAGLRARLGEAGGAPHWGLFLAVPSLSALLGVLFLPRGRREAHTETGR